MSNRFTRIVNRIKEARAQEYAHVYPFEGQSEEYQYPEEDKRVNSEKRTKQQGTEGYKIKIQPPIRGASDPGVESYKLQADPRDDEAKGIQESAARTEKQISNEQSYKANNPGKPPSTEFLDRTRVQKPVEQKPQTTKPKCECEEGCTCDSCPECAAKNKGKGKPDATKKVEKNLEVNASKQFKVGSKVKHSEEGIEGTVKFVNEFRVAVAWNDGTRERFAADDAVDFLLIVVDNDLADKTTIITPEKDYSALEQMLKNLDTEKEEDDDGDGNSNETAEKPQVKYTIDEENDEDESKIKVESRFDIEKVKMERKLKEYENKEAHQIKSEAAREIVALMQMKGLIDDTDAAAQDQLDQLTKLDDTGFEAFKNFVVKAKTAAKSTPKSISRVASNEDDDDDVIITEADERSSRSISASGGVPRRNGAKPITRQGGEEISLGSLEDIAGIKRPIQIQGKPLTPMAQQLLQLPWGQTRK